MHNKIYLLTGSSFSTEISAVDAKSVQLSSFADFMDRFDFRLITGDDFFSFSADCST